MEIILASGNAHKAEEFAELFDEKLIAVSAASKKIEVVEDGVSFEENAFKKAEAYYKEFKTPILSDDSGLVVEALPDELGIKTARYGGEGLSDKERYHHLLKNLEEVENRKAYFVCVLCFYLAPEEVFFFEGRCFGNISKEALGLDGFGYDPVFIPENSNLEGSFAQNPQWKMINSHRAKAVKIAQQFFASRT
jgi:XTP/dITP diphosphohydrolase